ncbi:unnamed protein product, partial [Prorocentrum cordatum]
DASTMEARGPAITEPQTSRSEGVGSVAGISGELSAAAEAPLRNLGQREMAEPLVPDGRLAQRITKSTRAHGLLQETPQLIEMSELVLPAAHLRRRARTRAELGARWIKGQSGNIGNGQADLLAQRGADKRCSGLHWGRPHPGREWGAAGRRQLCRERARTQSAARNCRCAEIAREDGGDTPAGRPGPPLAEADYQRQGVPSITVLTEGTAAGAAAAGVPGLLYLERPKQLRMRETDLRARHLLGPPAMK